MTRKVMKKSRTGRWVIATMALLAIGGGALANNNSTENKVAPETKEIKDINTSKVTKNKSIDKTVKNTNPVENAVAIDRGQESFASIVTEEALNIITAVSRLDQVVAVNNQVSSQNQASNENTISASLPSNQVTDSVVDSVLTPIIPLPTLPSDDSVHTDNGETSGTLDVEVPATPTLSEVSEEPTTPSKPIVDPVVPEISQPETPTTPEVIDPVSPEKPVIPEDNTTIISEEEKDKELPVDEVKPGGNVTPGDSTVISDKEVSGGVVDTPSDKPETDGGTLSVVTPGVETTTPSTPTEPTTPSTNEDGDVVNPEVPSIPSTTTRTDLVTDTTVINYGTSYVKDNTLAPGTQKVLTAGSNGSRVVVSEVTYTNGAETGRVVVSEITTPAVTEVIAYNDEAPSTREEVVETKNTISHGTIRRATTDLKEGEERVVTKGVDGTSVTTTLNVYSNDGVLISSTVQSEVVTSDPVDEVIEYGVAAKDTVKVTEERTTETIPFQTETRENSELYKGEERVVTKGVDGYQVKIATVTTTNGVEISREVKDGERVEPVTQIVEVGTKDRVETSVEEVRESIPFAKETRETDELYKGETRVEVAGKNGERIIKRTTTVTNGESSVVDEVVSETEPVNEVTLVGTKEKTETTTNEVVEEIDYETETRENAELKKGERKIVTAGVKGKRTVIVTQTKLASGEIIENREIVSEVAPVKEIVEIGTKEDVRYEMRVEREELDFETITKKVDTLFEGETREVTQGQKGRKATTYKDSYINGKLIGSEVVGDPVIVKPIDRIIEVGTKKEVTEQSIDTSEVINFKTVTETDSNMEEGQTSVRVKGENGSREVRITRKTNNRTGEVTETKEVLSEKPAVNEILVVGTKPKVVEPDYLTKTSLTLEEFSALNEEQQDSFIARQGTFVSGTNMSKDNVTQDTLNKVEELINLEKLNNAFVELLNEARTSKGLSPVVYGGQNSLTQKAATTRANEMADYGSLRYQDKESGAHLRPDGSKWSTVYNGETLPKNTYRGENALQFGRATNPKQAANEAKLAKSMFEQWMGSKSHYDVMMKNRNNLEVSIALALGFEYMNPNDKAGIAVGMMEMLEMLPK